ncbi:MarP family serine protease [Actinoalloteichus spitiensis]|uniref:MarP family serine protease n=1 Tax=Actinoalloteichus spitiensis TaxID=252394 RepID=UPI00037E4512|nr:MarP family serine protease [Actinoalloteichus spitiensis]
MNWVDAAVLVAVVLGAISGVRHGMAVAICAGLGVVGGAVGGLMLAPWVADQLEGPPVQLAVALSILFSLVVIGQLAGVYVGRSIKRRLGHSRLSRVDNFLGGVVQGLMVVLVAWLVALPITSAASVPWLAAAVKESRVLGTVDDVMPPEAKGLPNELGRLFAFSGFPHVLDPFSRTPAAEVDPPDPELQASATVRRVRESVVRVHGQAMSCQRLLNGSGFVVAPHRVMTNAHVVAGADQVTVEVERASLRATVVLYDPSRDVALLDVPDLYAEPLDFAPDPAATGDGGIVLGYPLGGPYTASAARVRQRMTLTGPDIYDQNTVEREIYTVRSAVRSGNSGGPLVDPDGRVLGVVFGAAADQSETGYVLTNAEIDEDVRAATRLTDEVPTGECSA